MFRNWFLLKVRYTFSSFPKYCLIFPSLLSSFHRSVRLNMGDTSHLSEIIGLTDIRVSGDYRDVTFMISVRGNEKMKFSMESLSTSCLSTYFVSDREYFCNVI